MKSSEQNKHRFSTRMLHYALGSKMLVLSGAAGDESSAKAAMKETIDSGAALHKLAEFVEAQNGDPSYVYDTELFEKAAYTIEIPALKAGYITHIEAESIGISCMTLGGGRETKESKIDLSVGILLKKKCGDLVKEGDTIALIYANDMKKAETAKQQILDAYMIGDTQPAQSVMIKAVID